MSNPSACSSRHLDERVASTKEDEVMWRREEGDNDDLARMHHYGSRVCYSQKPVHFEDMRE